MSDRQELAVALPPFRNHKAKSERIAIWTAGGIGVMEKASFCRNLYSELIGWLKRFPVCCRLPIGPAFAATAATIRAQTIAHGKGRGYQKGDASQRNSYHGYTNPKAITGNPTQGMPQVVCLMLLYFNIPYHIL